jgi:hypothetical protein
LEESAVKNGMMNSLAIRALALVALATGLYAGNPPARAAGVNDAWCMIDWEGNSHCYYASSQECLAAVASGSHGFCNVNPAAASASAASSPQAASRKRHP